MGELRATGRQEVAMMRGKPAASEVVGKTVQVWGRMASKTKIQLGTDSAIRGKKKWTMSLSAVNFSGRCPKNPPGWDEPAIPQRMSARTCLRTSTEPEVPFPDT